MAIKPFNVKLIDGINTVNLRSLYVNLSRFVYNNNDNIDLTIFNDSDSIKREIKRLYNHYIFNLKGDKSDLIYFFYPFKTEKEIKELI